MASFANGTVEAVVSGSGPAVWIFHSLLADAGSCAPLAQALGDRFTVTLPHLPGFGGSVATAPALDAVADRMAAAVGDAGSPVAIIGNGYGSFVALVLALRHPALVERLVLAGTGAAFDELGRQAFRGMAAAVTDGGLPAIADVAMRRLFASAFQDAHPVLMEHRRDAFLATNPVVFRGACDALAALDLRGAVAALKPPLLALAGEGDEATPPAMARELAALVPGARFALLPGLAHVPQLQDTPQFLAAIEGFLTQAPL
ncbi:MAG: alpha/beta fold hydrolase [Janthinobacterium lividum]